MVTLTDQTTRWTRWTARIISAIILAYVLLMLGGYAYNLLTLGVADPYAVEDVSQMESLPPILMFISAFALAAAFRWERLGGWVTLLLQLGVVVLLFIDNPTFEDFPRRALPYGLVVIIVLPAILFLISASRSAREHTT